MSISYSELYKCTKELSILFVEDYQPFIDEMKEILLELFKKVSIATDGENALNIYMEYNQKYHKSFDIVLTDLRLPKLDGIALCKAIYSINSNQKLIVISSYTKTEDLIELLNIGIKRFIKKPLDYDELCDTLYSVSSSFQNTKKKLPIKNYLIPITKEYNWDSEKKKLFSSGIEIYCTQYEIILLDFLTKNRNQICSMEMIIAIFQENNIDISSKSIRNLVLKIRKKTDKKCIQNIYGLGYCLQGL